MKFTISKKIIALFVLLIVILGASFAYYSVASEKEMFIREFDERAKILADGLAVNSGYQVFVEDVEALKKLGASTLAQKDVVFCEIRGKEGKVLFGEGSKAKQYIREYNAPILMRKITGQPGEELILGTKEEAMEQVGDLTLFLSFADLIKKVNETKRNVGLMVVTGIILAFIFIRLLVTLILSRPIYKLTRGIEVIAGGDLNYKVAISSRDEIGKLALSFNNMTEALQKITVSRDQLTKEVAERKKAQEELKYAYEQLKVVQAHLVQSAKMASIGQLAGGVAHEINNPLTGVLNNVQLIRMEQKEKGKLNAAEFNELLGIIEESALRCKKITQSLLDFSYASKGVIQPVSLNELVEKVIELIAYEMKKYNITIQKEFAPDLPKISGDPQLLQQVIFDLVANARLAVQEKSGKAGGVITIKTESKPENKQVCISISDTGIGISQENLPHMFEPFFTTKQVGEGTGLGLSIVYNIIKQHKGNIEVESKVNEGTAFRISLPL